MGSWTLTGTANQKAIAQAALDKIKFPFDRLNLPGSPELGWRDLNGGGYFMSTEEAHEKGLPHDHGHTGDSPEPLMGMIDGRRWIMGCFYPVSARIYIDVRCEAHPELAWGVVSAEIAHAVDEFLPLTDTQRDQIMSALHPHGPDHHSWWEKNDYGAEYYDLVGETFMILFTKAYSDIPFGNTSDFTHGGETMTPEAVRSIIGIERTDKPVKPPRLGVGYGKSKIYHRPTHYPAKKISWELYGATPSDGYRPCKVCKP